MRLHFGPTKFYIEGPVGGLDGGEPLHGGLSEIFALHDDGVYPLLAFCMIVLVLF